MTQGSVCRGDSWHVPAFQGIFAGTSAKLISPLLSYIFRQLSVGQVVGYRGTNRISDRDHQGLKASSSQNPGLESERSEFKSQLPT